MQTLNKALAAVALILMATAASGEVVEAIVARVGDRIITRTQYLTRLQDGLRELEGSVPPTQLDQRKKTYRDNLFNEMVAELLIKDRADRLGLSVTAQEVTESVKRLMAQYNLQSEEAFEESLRSSGLSRSEMESRLRDTLLTNKVFGRELRSRGEISDRELRQRYDREKDTYRLPERARVKEIVVVPASAEVAEWTRAMAESEEAVTRARAGEPFATLVTEYSDAPSKEQEGAIGLVAKGELLAELDQAVFSTAAGSVAGPVRTASGYHVMLVEERLPSEIPSFDAVKERLRQEAGEETFQRDYEAYIERLRKEAFVQIHEENLPAG